MHQATDEELIAEARAARNPADRNAIVEQLFERHYRRVALWCLRWTRNRDDAQDLAQEIFLKVYRNLDSFQGSSKFTTWLFTVCRNHCINSATTARSRECAELDEILTATLPSVEPDPEQQLFTRRHWAAARELMDQHLDETERHVLLLHYAEGLSLPMVTRVLNLTNASGAKAYIVSSHRKLKAAVERWKARSTRST